MTTKYVNPLFVVLLILCHLTVTGHGQRPGWTTYSSSSDQFTVAVPAGVRISKTADSKSEASLTSEQMDSLASHISIHEAAAAPDEVGKFQILVVNAKAKILDSISRQNLLTYLSVMLIGDDDDPWPTSQTIIKANGLTGKEYVWAKKAKVFEYGSTLEIFRRGRIFDQGDKIYVLVFDGESAAELKSPLADRFLNSFRLHTTKPSR